MRASLATSEMESSTCSQLTADSRRKPYVSVYVLKSSMNCVSVLFCSILHTVGFAVAAENTGRKEKGGEKNESQKQDNKKSQERQTGGKRGGGGEVWRGSVRHTNPYLKRWRLIWLPQQSLHSGNDGLWEGEKRRKAIM